MKPICALVAFLFVCVLFAAPGLVDVAHSTENDWESGWVYKYQTNDFTDEVTHIASNASLKNGEDFGVAVMCAQQNLVLLSLKPGRYYHSQDFLDVDVRVDKNLAQNFKAIWFKGSAVLSPDPPYSASQGEFYNFIRDLTLGSKLIFRVGRSRIATFSLAGSTEPIRKVLRFCNIKID